MKAEQFQIKANGVIFDTRRTFNACWRSIEAKVKEVAIAELTTYRLQEKKGNKEGFYMTSGHCIWKSDKGVVIKFEINKL